MTIVDKLNELVKRAGSLYAVSRDYDLPYTTLHNLYTGLTHEDYINVKTYRAIESAWRDENG